MDTPIPTETVTELKVGDRVQVADEGREDDYGIVVETARQIWTNVPTSYLTVEVPRVGNATVYIPEADVRRIPPGEEQEISLRPWVVTGESICDDPDEYNHPHQLFVHEGSLPEIIRVYLAANGLSAPGSTKAAPKDDETAERLRAAVFEISQLRADWVHAYVGRAQKAWRGGSWRSTDADRIEREAIAKWNAEHPGLIALWKSHEDRAASLRGNQ